MTTLDDLINRYGKPCYVQIDVEGFELPVLKGLTQSVPLISFECNLPEFTEETKEAIHRLVALSPAAEFNYCLTEPPEALVSNEWLSSKVMQSIVETEGHRFMEIYCRSK